MSVVSVTLGEHLSRVSYLNLAHTFSASSHRRRDAARLEFIKEPAALAKATIGDVTSIALGAGAWVLVALLSAFVLRHRDILLAAVTGPLGVSL